MPDVDAKGLYGTKLIGEVHDINNEPEHKRIGLTWEISGNYLMIKTQPRPNANMSNVRGVCEEVARHLKAQGVNVKWPFSNGKYECLEIRPEKIKKVKCW